MHKRILRSFSLILVLASISWSQSPSPANKTTPEDEKLAANHAQLVEAAVAELPQLQRVENQIYVRVQLADLLWGKDLNRARNLMNEAVASYFAFAEQMKAVEEQNEPRVQWVEFLRAEISQVLANHDGRMALDFARKVRAADPANNQQVRAEARSMELNIAAQIADDDPKMALQIVKENLESENDYQALGVWEQLRHSDAEAASELYDLMLKKIKTADAENKQMAWQTTSRLLLTLGEAAKLETNPKEPATKAEQQARQLSLRQYKDLLDWICGEALKINTYDLANLEQAMEVRMLVMLLKSQLEDVKKHLPHRFAAVQTKLEQLDKPGTFESFYTQYQKKYEQLESKPPEEIIAMAQKASPQERQILMQRAVEKAMSEDNIKDEVQVRKLIQENIDNPDTQREMLNQLTVKAASASFSSDKLEDAKKRLNEIRNPMERARMMLNWAAQKLADKDQKSARVLTDEVSNILGDRFTTREHVSMQLQVAELRADWDAERALAICTSVIDRLVVVGQAQLAVMTYEQRGSDDVDGEQPIWQTSSFLPYEFTRTLKTLSKTNFESVRALVKRWPNTAVQMHCWLTLAREMTAIAPVEARARIQPLRRIIR